MLNMLFTNKLTEIELKELSEVIASILVDENLENLNTIEERINCIRKEFMANMSLFLTDPQIKIILEEKNNLIDSFSLSDDSSLDETSTDDLVDTDNENSIESAESNDSEIQDSSAESVDPNVVNTIKEKVLLQQPNKLQPNVKTALQLGLCVAALYKHPNLVILHTTQKLIGEMIEKKYNLNKEHVSLCLSVAAYYFEIPEIDLFTQLSKAIPDSLKDNQYLSGISFGAALALLNTASKPLEQELLTRNCLHWAYDKLKTVAQSVIEEQPKSRSRAFLSFD